MLTGLAGLAAGAFSMAAGEYRSPRSGRHTSVQEHDCSAYGDDCVTVDDELWSAVGDRTQRYKAAVDSSSDEGLAERIQHT